jgi:hypothetical protein
MSDRQPDPAMKELGLMIGDLLDMAKLAGLTDICNAPCVHGGGCSLTEGHDGDHEARSRDREVLCSWPQE